jgi:biofilm PGA synthesis N-glycosyltransferase PgaC
MINLMESIQNSTVYLIVLVFFAWYPLFMSAVWVFTALVFYFRRERPGAAVTAEGYEPFMTVLIAAYNEEEHIEQTVRGCLNIDYPNYEVVIVDDGSSDRTVEKLMPLVRDNKIRLIRKLVNEGKAMALNDAIPRTRGEILLIIDADAVPDPGILRAVAPHFRWPRVGAVTGNPRVINRSSLLAKLQAIEFTSIVSLQRRGARVWGKLLTMSGVVGAFHRDALFDVGLYSPQMATEDIDVTWKLQLRFWDIRYEPRALVWMRVPVSLKGLWMQRRRWAHGLAQVLRRHLGGILTWEARRLWPILVESAMSILWAYSFVVLTVLWAFSFAFGYPPVGASPIPNYWGMLIGTMCLIQLAVGVTLDSRYDDKLRWYYGLAIFYPLIYWILMAFVAVAATPKGLRASRKPVRWKPVRETG